MFLKTYKEKAWAKEVDPKSKIALMILLYLLLPATWNHATEWILILLALGLTTPFWFPSPEDRNQWLTIAVEGEKIWWEKGNDNQKFAVVGINGLLVFILAIALWEHWLLASIVLTTILTLAKAIFLTFAHNIALSFKNFKDDDLLGIH